MRVVIFNESRNIGMLTSPGTEQMNAYFQETLALTGMPFNLNLDAAGKRPKSKGNSLETPRGRYVHVGMFRKLHGTSSRRP